MQWIFDPYLKPKMDTDKELFKNLTAEALSSRSEEFLPNRETTIGQKAVSIKRDMFLFVVVSRQTKKQFSATSVPPRCKIIICINRRESAVNSIPILSWLKGCCDA